MSSTKSDIAMFALKIICSKSFSTFSYDDIAREFNMTRAAVHYHFKNKEDLGIAICNTFRDLILESRQQDLKAAQGGRHPWHFIETMFKTFPSGGICPIVSLQADYDNLPERMRPALAELTKVELDYFRLLTQAYNDTVDFTDVIPIVLSLKGALQYRRVMGEEFFENTVKIIKSRFFEAIPKPHPEQ